jgi:hypothetical protein
MSETFATPDDFGDLHASELHTSLGEQLGAEAGEAFMGGTRQLARISDYLGAEHGWNPLAAMGAGEGPAGAEQYQSAMASIAAQPDVPIADAKARVKQEGLEAHVNLPDQPSIRQPVLDLMLQGAHERTQYEAAVNRGPQGFLPDALGFVTQMGVGMIDPVNAAAFLIPVLGEARYGMMLARAGDSIAARAALRAGVGAAQGTVGGAALVPADWWLHTQDGQDYTFANALKSVALTAGMGGLFHGGFGTLADLRARYKGAPLSGSPADLLLQGVTRAGAAPVLPDIPPEEVPGVSGHVTTPRDSEAEAPPPSIAAAPAEPDNGPRSVFKDALEQLRATGMPEDEARHNAAVVTARYETRAERLGDGRDAYDLYKSEGLTIQRPEEEQDIPGRQFAQAAMIDGVRADFPDEDHINLFDVGRRLADKERVPNDELQHILERFKGFAIEDDNVKFRSLSDVRELASEYYDTVQDHARHREPFEAPDVIEPDRKAAWYRRALSEIDPGSVPVQIRTEKGQLRLFQSAKRPAGERNLVADREAEGQQSLPGTERIGQGELAHRRINEPLKPKVEQRPMDIGLFGDESKQGSLFQRGELTPRGRITLQENRAIVDLFANADQSTFMHEMGHKWLEEMIRDAAADDAPAGVKSDLAAVLKWLGVEKASDIGTEQHEQWARGFEQYLAEGKAPSSRLAAAFAKFKDWLLSIYHGLVSFDAPLSDDVRGVMDRMLASDREIAEMREAPPHPAQVLADLPQRVQQDVVHAAAADIIAGRPVRVGDMLAEAAKQDPRIAESVNGAGGRDDYIERVRALGSDIDALAERVRAQRGVANLGAIDNSHDVVSGANSAKDPKGPVYVDRRIPEFSPTLKDRNGQPANLWKYLATHERTEAEAEARGMPYLKAHTDVATPAERAAVEADGVSWKAYTDEIDGYLAHIEHEKAANPPTEPLHVDPGAAIGHHHSSNKQAGVDAAPRVPGAAAGDNVVHVQPRRGPATRDPNTFSLLEFLASNGGIRNDDALISDLRGSIGQNKFIPGFGNLIRNPRALSTAERMGGRKAPMTLDQAREAAVNAGYIADHDDVTGGAARSTIDTLLQAIDEEARGRRRYREGQGPKAVEIDHGQELHEADGALDQALTREGLRPEDVSGKTRERTLEIMLREGMAHDPLGAYERAVMEANYYGAEAGQFEPRTEKIPGWDAVLDDGAAAPGRGGEAAPGQEAGGARAGETPRPGGDPDRGRSAPARGVADFKKFADVERPVTDPALSVESRLADETREPASTDAAKAPSAAEAAAADADKLLADMLPTLSEDERKIFEDKLSELEHDKAAREQMIREGAACLAAAAA